MRAFLCAALLCVAGSASSEILQGDELKAKVDKQCQEGCLILNQMEVMALEQAIEQYVADRLNEAYEYGKREANETCLKKV